MFSQAKGALKCVFIPFSFISNNGSPKPNEKHVLAAFERGTGIFVKNSSHFGGHLGFLGPYHDSSQSSSFFLHPRHVSNHLCNNFLWTSHDHRHPLRDCIIRKTSLESPRSERMNSFIYFMKP